MIKQAKVLKEYLAPGNLISSKWFLQRRLSCESMFENPRLVPDSATRSGPDNLSAISKIISGGRLSISTKRSPHDVHADKKECLFPGFASSYIFAKKYLFKNI